MEIWEGEVQRRMTAGNVYKLNDLVVVCLRSNLWSVQPRVLQELCALNIWMIFLSGLIHLNAKAKVRLNDNNLQKHLRNTERWLIRRLLKDTEEKENEVQKRRHEEAKQERKNKGLKHAARRKLITQREEAECIWMCHICKRSSKHGNELCCDDCQTFYHELWITRYHKFHSPDSEDSDTLVCHICYKQDNTQNSRRNPTECW